jgi:penicillin-binding protein A
MTLPNRPTINAPGPESTEGGATSLTGETSPLARAGRETARRLLKPAHKFALLGVGMALGATFATIQGAPAASGTTPPAGTQPATGDAAQANAPGETPDSLQPLDPADAGIVNAALGNAEMAETPEAIPELPELPEADVPEEPEGPEGDAEPLPPAGAENPDAEADKAAAPVYVPGKGVTHLPKLGPGERSTLDPRMQRFVETLYKNYNPPFAATVAIDIQTGEVLTYAQHRATTGLYSFNHDINRAEFPAASLFKLFTATTLREEENLDNDGTHCYGGGAHGLNKKHLVPNPRRDRRCVTFNTAMGKSANVVFARLAHNHLEREDFLDRLPRFGFGMPLTLHPASAIRVTPAKAVIPTDPFERAKTAAGFGEVEVSPLLAAMWAQAIANDGVMVQPRFGKATKGAAPQPVEVVRMMSPETAEWLTETMVETATTGTARRGFMRPGVRFIGKHTAGKTGSIARKDPYRDYSWFIGFAPVEAPRIAVASVVVNGAKWRFKSWYPASEYMRYYFSRTDHTSVEQAVAAAEPPPKANIKKRKGLKPSGSRARAHRPRTKAAPAKKQSQG